MIEEELFLLDELIYIETEVAKTKALRKIKKKMVELYDKLIEKIAEEQGYMI